MDADQLPLERTEAQEFREGAETHLQPRQSMEAGMELRREQMARRMDSGPALEQLTSEQVEQQIAWFEQYETPELGHSLDRHVGKSEADLMKRAQGMADEFKARTAERHEHLSRSEPGDARLRPPPENVTTFRSSEALVACEATAWEAASKDRGRVEAEVHDGELVTGQAKIEIEVPLKEALGPDWRDQVNGKTVASRGEQSTQFNDESFARVVYRMDENGHWYVKSCFPKPLVIEEP